MGYVVKDQHAALLYSGDTYETEEIWSLGRSFPELKAAFIESSFPNEFADLAKQTKHLTPLLLAQEWRKLRNDQVPVYAYHLKPPYNDQIRRELRELHIPGIQILRRIKC